MEERETIRLDTVYNGLKLFVSAIAVVMLAKTFVESSPAIYSTVFVFISDKAIDNFFVRSRYVPYLYKWWGILNGILGSVACIAALCIPFWSADGSSVDGCILIGINVFYRFCIGSLVLRDMILAIYFPCLREREKERIISSEKRRRTRHE